jgi:hypothetical protein
MAHPGKQRSEKQSDRAKAGLPRRRSEDVSIAHCVMGRAGTVTTLASLSLIFDPAKLSDLNESAF